VQAGQNYLEDKTFHYLSNSLFDLSDDDVQTQHSNVIVNPEMDSTISENVVANISSADEELIENLKPKSRNKFGVIDENYGQTRFGAMFMDVLVQKEARLGEDEIQHEINSTYFVFYGIQVNLSANLLHRF
jgi:hypothetical protein